jgi:hypothetical protein
VHAESVAWISGRKDVVSAAFVFAALLAHLRARRRGSAGLFALSAALALLACLSKSTATALPGLVLAVEVLDPGRDPAAPVAWPRRMLRVVPSLAVCGAAALLAVWVGGRTGVRQAGRPLDAVLLIDLTVLRRYVVTCLVPIRLQLTHSDLLGQVLTDPARRLSQAMLAAAALLPLAGALALSRRRGAWFVGLWFLAGLAPVLNLVPFSQWIADRFLCLPVLAPCLGLAWGVVWLAARRPRLAILAAAMVVGSWTGLAANRGREFTTSERLWQAQLALTPDDPLALRHLGDAHLRRAQASSDPAEARRLARSATAELEAALRAFEESELSAPGHHMEAALVLARAYALLDEATAARWVLQRAAGRFPNQPAPLLELGNLEVRRGEWAHGARAYGAVLQLLAADSDLPAAEHGRYLKAALSNVVYLWDNAQPDASPAELGGVLSALDQAGQTALANALLDGLRARDRRLARLVAAERTR